MASKRSTAKAKEWDQGRGTPKAEGTSNNQQPTRKRMKERKNRLVKAKAQTMMMLNQKKNKRKQRKQKKQKKQRKLTTKYFIGRFFVGEWRGLGFTS
jgi:hypothetical protein